MVVQRTPPRLNTPEPNPTNVPADSERRSRSASSGSLIERLTIAEPSNVTERCKSKKPAPDHSPDIEPFDSPEFSPSTLIPNPDIRHIKETFPPEELVTNTETLILRMPTKMSNPRIPRPVPPPSPPDPNEKDEDNALIAIINRHTDNIDKFIMKIPTLEKDGANFA
ncbi:hypothetical protein CROQUDRAFT_97833 [Cronartium quercuum f. sp. fusiforme G11]|uniref:Uncharacterized protein n=1 Tax=Cronartium quercuum f. sp. fusiforme G11 TaxID=708437 RepID=A0A9P6NED5_9BASI|nr:hypothetical protein CROQUDRAFT_97833 [Cronartium quercuum f. sp. fusiforme G11]